MHHNKTIHFNNDQCRYIDLVMAVGNLDSHDIAIARIVAAAPVLDPTHGFGSMVRAAIDSEVGTHDVKAQLTRSGQMVNSFYFESDDDEWAAFLAEMTPEVKTIFNELLHNVLGA